MTGKASVINGTADRSDASREIKHTSRMSVCHCEHRDVPGCEGTKPPAIRQPEQRPLLPSQLRLWRGNDRSEEKTKLRSLCAASIPAPTAASCTAPLGSHGGGQ